MLYTFEVMEQTAQQEQWDVTQEIDEILSTADTIETALTDVGITKDRQGESVFGGIASSTEGMWPPNWSEIDPYSPDTRQKLCSLALVLNKVVGNKREAEKLEKNLGELAACALDMGSLYDQQWSKAEEIGGNVKLILHDFSWPVPDMDQDDTFLWSCAIDVREKLSALLSERDFLADLECKIDDEEYWDETETGKFVKLAKEIDNYSGGLDHWGRTMLERIEDLKHHIEDIRENQL